MTSHDTTPPFIVNLNRQIYFSAKIIGVTYIAGNVVTPIFDSCQRLRFVIKAVEMYLLTPRREGAVTESRKCFE